MKEDCIYLGLCENECPNVCIKYSEMSYLLKMSGIPKNRQCIHRLKPDECDIQAFEKLAEIQSNIVDFTDSGGILYIYSNRCGNGKTTWTIKMMLQYFNEIWEGNCLEPRGVFINIPSFLNKIKSTISYPDSDFEALRANIERVDLVVFDDISAGLSQYDYSNLYSYIDSRSFQGKAMIFTSNYSPSELKSIMGERITSRICNGINIEIKGGDMR